MKVVVLLLREVTWFCAACSFGRHVVLCCLSFWTARGFVLLVLLDVTWFCAVYSSSVSQDLNHVFHDLDVAER